jgi:hypothetical protein
MRTATFKILPAALLLSLSLSCSQEPCDSTSYLYQGTCMKKADSGGLGPIDTGGAADPVDTGTGGGSFGSPCSSDNDCASPSNICFPVFNYCSAVGCDLDQNLCPAGWTCFDLGNFQPGAPWGCTK